MTELIDSISHIAIGLGGLFFFALVSSIAALYLKHLDNKHKALKEFPDSAETGVFVANGLKKDLKTGRTRGERRPAGISSVS